MNVYIFINQVKNEILIIVTNTITNAIDKMHDVVIDRKGITDDYIFSHSFACKKDRFSTVNLNT